MQCPWINLAIAVPNDYFQVARINYPRSMAPELVELQFLFFEQSTTFGQSCGVPVRECVIALALRSPLVNSQGDLFPEVPGPHLSEGFTIAPPKRNPGFLRYSVPLTGISARDTILKG